MKKFYLWLLLAFLLEGGLAQESNVSETSVGTYAAIAYSLSSSRHGFGVNYPSAEAAATRALQECHQRAADCKLIAEFSKQCAALVVGVTKPETFAPYLAFAKDESSAEIEAFAKCSSKNCRLRRLICTAGNY